MSTLWYYICNMSLYEQIHATETQTPEAVLIIPALNEASRLNGDPFKRALYANMTEFSRLFTQENQLRMVVVDDGSTDETGNLASEFGYDVVYHPVNLGKGAAIRSGVRAVLDSLIEPVVSNVSMAFTDADGSYSAETLIRLIAATKESADIGIVNRFEGDKSNKNWRDLAHPAVQQFLRFVTPTGVSDPQAGAMAFSGAAIDLWKDSKIDRYATPTEVLYKAKKLGLATVEISALMTNVGESHVKPIDGLKIMSDALRIRLNRD